MPTFSTTYSDVQLLPDERVQKLVTVGLILIGEGGALVTSSTTIPVGGRKLVEMNHRVAHRRILHPPLGDVLLVHTKQNEVVLTASEMSIQHQRPE